MSQKKLLILGATGGTGQQLLTQALAAGHNGHKSLRAVLRKFRFGMIASNSSQGL